MSTTYLGEGRTINVTAPTGGYTTGDFVQFPSTGTALKMLGVAKETVAAGSLCAVAVEGVYQVTTKKAGAGEAWAVGDDVYITATGDFTETATSNGYAGVAWEAAATGATTGKVRINFGGDPR